MEIYQKDIYHVWQILFICNESDASLKYIENFAISINGTKFSIGKPIYGYDRAIDALYSSFIIIQYINYEYIIKIIIASQSFNANNSDYNLYNIRIVDGGADIWYIKI